MIKIKSVLTIENFQEMYNLEKTFYDESYITPVIEAYGWYEKNPDCTKALYKKEELIGFCNVFPVYSQVFERLCKGELNDHEMTKEHMLGVQEYYEGMDLFFSCIAIKESYRSKEIIKQLLKEALRPYTQEVLVGIQVNSVVMDTVTPEGEKFAQACGLMMWAKSDHHSVIWHGDFNKLVERYIK